MEDVKQIDANVTNSEGKKPLLKQLFEYLDKHYII